MWSATQSVSIPVQPPRNLHRTREVAEKHHLKVVNGKIPVPDLRVEYETPELELRRVDLELATRDYRPRAMAEKASAGFSLYGCSEDASRLRRVLDEREIGMSRQHPNLRPFG
jgi:hypothetical protein